MGAYGGSRDMPHTASRTHAPKNRRMKVLVADPARDAEFSKSEAWAQRGFEPVVAHDAIETLQHFRDDAPGVVLLDDRLPGFELSGLVRILHATSVRSQVPVLLLSHAEDGAAAADAIGADGFIPVSETRGRLPEALAHAVALTRGHRK